MSSGDESVINDIVSERDTQFVYQPGDEEVLWEVQAITAERGKKYKVKWAGVDPTTGKPWAQSWVAKHDCTDDLVIDWKAKQKRLADGKKKRGGRTSTTSRASKRTGSSTSGTKTRRSTTSSRVDSVERHVSPPLPPKLTASKRKLESETPATASSGVGQTDAQSEPSRPRKKQRTMVEVLLPPISSDEDALPVPEIRAKGTLKNKMPPKSNGASLDVRDEDDSSPPKAKGKDEHRSEARPKGTAVSTRPSDVREESRLPHAKAKVKIVPRRKERAVAADALSAESEDEELPPHKSKQKSTPKPKPTSARADAPFEKEVESIVQPIKIGPPRGVKRQGMSKKPRPSSKPGPSRIQPREDDSAGERAPAEEYPCHLDHEVSAFGSPLPLRQNQTDARTSPAPHVSIPQVSPSLRPRSLELSPGARARLELFDRMMADLPQPDAGAPPDVSEHAPDDAHFNLDDPYDTHDAFDTLDPPLPLSSPPSKPKADTLKLGAPNGLIVPETESSGNSQSQTQVLLKPPSPLPPARDDSPRKPIDLPTIAVIAASATSSSASPQDPLPPQKLPPPTNRPSKRPTFKIIPSTRSRVADSEAPPSSIESFASPRRVDKGKQKAVEDDQLKSSFSEGEGDGECQKKRMQKKITDSALKRRGKELFDQAQRVREADWQKNKKAKRLKSVNEIINGTSSPPPKGSPILFTGGAESVPEMRLEDVVDLSGGANSTTLDSPEHSEPKPLSEEERERLRIELRQEEEESTQEAMGIYPPPPAKEFEVTNGGDVQMPPPSFPENPSSSGHIEDVDPVEQPSTDLQLASVIVQASQEQGHEDMDIEPMPANQPTSSPPCSIPENLTDSPRRRLGEALSLLNVKSEEIQRLERELADERKNLQGLKVELAELRQSSEPTGPVCAAWEAKRAQMTQERTKWENDFSLWETQRKEMSDENANLSARVVELSDAAVRAEEARVRLSELEAERVAWTKERDAMLNDMVQRSEELALVTKVRGEDDQDRIKWEAERALWFEEKAGWETERTALQEKQEALLGSINELSASVESMRAAKASAEKDRDFFREQYVQASGFVGSVREENMELEKRAKIAEGQAQEGVAAIKALFEGRVNALQADVVRWKGLTELLQEKDRRTNDELRLRAAQAPEFRELCGRLHEENKSLEADVRKLGQAQQRSVLQRNKLFYDIFLLKKERASLKSKLSKLAKTADSSTLEASHSAPSPPILEDPESMDPNDMELLPDPTPQLSDVTFDEPALFPCMWRPEWRDQCQQIFDSKEDLERHVQDHFRDLQAQ